MERIKAYMCNPGNYGVEEIAQQFPCIPSKYIEWVEEPQELNVFVDCWVSPCINLLENDLKYKIAVLVEPYSLCPFHYNWVLAHQDKFDLIYSTYPFYGKNESNPDKFIYFEGGARSLIPPSEWEVYPKSKNITSIVSWNKYMEGHKLRHVIRDKYLSTDLIDYPKPPTGRKVEGLKDYRFELVIENEDGPFFSEKLVDSMLAGCIPIYWTSDESYLGVFDKEGIVTFKTIEELYNLIDSGVLNEEYYFNRIESVKHNFIEAQKYLSLGDMLWDKGIKNLIA